MARERKRVWGELAGVQMAHLSRIMTGAKIDPNDLNPYALRPPAPPKSEAAIQRESDLAWKLLDRFFGGEK